MGRFDQPCTNLPPPTPSTVLPSMHSFIFHPACPGECRQMKLEPQSQLGAEARAGMFRVVLVRSVLTRVACSTQHSMLRLRVFFVEIGSLFRSFACPCWDLPVRVEASHVRCWGWRSVLAPWSLDLGHWTLVTGLWTLIQDLGSPDRGSGDSCRSRPETQH